MIFLLFFYNKQIYMLILMIYIERNKNDQN